MRKDIIERKNEIIEWIKNNRSKSFISRELKCKQCTLDIYLEKMGIEYEGNQGSKGKPSNTWKHSSLYLFRGSLIGGHKLKLKLFRDGIKEKKCEVCGLEKWNEKDISLEMHHIDGDRMNNELENLQILCPNCHSQTTNYSLSKDFIKNGKGYE